MELQSRKEKGAGQEMENMKSEHGVMPLEALDCFDLEPKYHC